MLESDTFHNFLPCIPLLTALFQLLACPFSKVEESFNLQAIHDLAVHQTNVSAFDHLQFPGVVPRTFIGPLAVVSCLLPLVFRYQSIARLTLGVLVWAAYWKFHLAVGLRFGRSTAFWLALITATQFHFCFYSTRTLPNIFALIFVLLTLSYIYLHHYAKAVWPAVASVIVFRSELVLFYGPLFLPALIWPTWHRFSYLQTTLHGIAAAALSLTLTLAVDSFFWQQPWMWPEGAVWYYNVILNKSSNWGTEPFHWYFTSALPRALGASSFFAVLACKIGSKTFNIVILPAVSFVVLYSFLPHKELRFIIYAIPLFNLAAAKVCKHLCDRRRRSNLHKALAFLALAHLFANHAYDTFSTYVSSQNYPGGEALQKLHYLEYEMREQNATVHIDEFCAQTGISLYSYEFERWHYSKQENLADGSAELRQFTFLLIGRDNAAELDQLVALYGDTHRLIHKESAYAGLRFFWWRMPALRFPFFRIAHAEKVAILKKID